MKDEGKVWIPKVSRGRINKLAKRIKPVIQFTHSIFRGKRYIKPVDLFGVAYTWDPKPRRRARNLKPLCDITTYHAYGYYGCFKPSVAEVLAQIPKEYLDKVIAFEIIRGPETADDLNREKEALQAGYHVATTRLYVHK